MTNSQYIEVAEKVWGWIPTDSGAYKDWDCVAEGSHWDSDRLGREINSWQGFGRTVEAMAEKLIHFTGNKFHWWNEQKQRYQDIGIIWDHAVPTALIEATHLAALEAIDD